MTNVDDELRDEELEHIYKGGVVIDHPKPYDFEKVSKHAEEYFYQQCLEALCIACEHMVGVTKLVCIQRGCDTRRRLEGRLYAFFEMGR